jgi:hypothetical protein
MAMPSANCGSPKLAKKGKSIGKNYAISTRTFPNIPSSRRENLIEKMLDKSIN